VKQLNLSLRSRLLLAGLLVLFLALVLVVGVEGYLLNSGQDELIREIVIVCVVALALTAVFTIMLYAWLTRGLRRLADASARLAAGDLTVRLPTQSDDGNGANDEIGKLGAAFNGMADALSSRIQALAQGEAKFTAIADYSYDCELWADAGGKLIWINPRVQEMFGYTPEECLAAQDFPVPFVSDPDVNRTVRQIRLAVLGNMGNDYEFRARRKDGSTFWAAADWRPIYDKNHQNQGIRISIRDITSRKEAEQRLEATVTELRDAQTVQKQYLERAQDEHARLSALLGAMNIGILFVSTENRVVYCNPAFSLIWMIPPGTRIIGADPVAMLTQSGCTLARPAEHTRHLLQPPAPGEPLTAFELPMADGRLVTQQSHTVEDAFGKPVGRMWIFEDVTTERRNADQLVYLAERDALTGLYNRHRFNEEMGRMVAEAQRGSSRVALLFFDLDEFKYINDTFGHRAGDATLIRVAGEVGGQVRRNEIFARLGGDEFAILVPDISDEMLKILAERITRSIAQIRFQFEGQSLRLTCSCGIAVYPDHARNTEDLVARADAAMYQAKESGKNAWRIYRADLDDSQRMVMQLSWNDRILHALENDLMELYFQGIYTAKERTLAHFEVLLRMRDKDNSQITIMPGQFIPVAEKSGKIVDIDRWVLSRSIKMLADVSAIPALAVNISGRSLDDPSLPLFIADELHRQQVPAQRLLVELTETSAVSDLHDARRFIEALQHTGCGVCLDDFGTGFSSFAYLKHLHVDAIKIDGLFIRNLPKDPDNQLFVKAMVSVARGLHKTIIAECVEDEETLLMLAAFGVDCVQGYHLEKPQASPPLMQTALNLRTLDLPFRR
jgi:diguanylate cyclase (GGDEF)-like protein/PAS domain S-box-containing protein